MRTLADKTVLVIGGTGFLGQRLLLRLAGSGAVLHSASRYVEGVQGQVRWWRRDVSDYAQVERLLQDVRPDVIYHLASLGQGGPDLDLVLPVLSHDLVGTVNLLVAAARVKPQRVVITASLEEPQPTDPEPTPASPYAAAKWAVTAYGRMFSAIYGLPLVTLRPYMSYGPGQKVHKVVPYATLALLRGETPRLSSGQRPIDWVYVDDVVDAFVRAATAPDVIGKTIDLGSGELVSVRKMIETVASVVDAGIVPEFGSLDDRPMEQVRAADVEPARRLLGWQAETPLRTGIERTVQWFRDQVAAGAPAQFRSPGA